MIVLITYADTSKSFNSDFIQFLGDKPLLFIWPVKRLGSIAKLDYQIFSYTLSKASQE